MSVIIRPRPQWGDWVALDTDDQPITDFSSISHAHLFAEGIRYVHGNIYHTILPCCQSSSQAPYASARDSAREVIQLAMNDIARRFGRWPNDPGVFRSIYHGNTEKPATYHAGAMFAIKIIRIRTKIHIEEERPNPCWKCFETVLDDLECNIHYFYLAAQMGMDIKPFGAMDSGQWILSERNIRHL
jgi:hypothetical protein